MGHNGIVRENAVHNIDQEKYKENYDRIFKKKPEDYYLNADMITPKKKVLLSDKNSPWEVRAIEPKKVYHYPEHRYIAKKFPKLHSKIIELETELNESQTARQVLLLRVAELEESKTPG